MALEAQARADEAVAKTLRLEKQVDHIEGQQESMVLNEWKNIAELEEEEAAADLRDPLVDVESEQILIPAIDNQWLSTSLASFETVGASFPYPFVEYDLFTRPSRSISLHSFIML